MRFPFALLVLLFATPVLASAKFTGKVMLSEKRFPTTAKSAAALDVAVEKQSKTSFAEAKATKSAKVYFVAFLKDPLNDVEYGVKLYKLDGSAQALLSQWKFPADETGQKMLQNAFTLESKTHPVNAQYLVTVESKGRALASGRFKYVGEGERFTGKATFTEEEAAGSADDKPGAAKIPPKKK